MRYWFINDTIVKNATKVYRLTTRTHALQMGDIPILLVTHDNIAQLCYTVIVVTARAVPAGQSDHCVLALRAKCESWEESLTMLITVEELVAKPKCTSGVWGFFGFILNEEGQPLNVCKAICKLCFRSISQRPKPVHVAIRGGNTSNLKVKG